MAYPSVTTTFTDGTGNYIYSSEVNQNFTDLINGASDGLKDLNVKNATATGNLTVNGNSTLGNSTADTVDITAGSVTLDAGTRLFIPRIGIGAETIPTLQISSGVLTPSTCIAYVQAESGTTDDLTAVSMTTIGTYDGMLMLLIMANGHTITVKNNVAVTNYIKCGSDRALSTDDTMLLVASGSKWLMVSFADN